MGALEHARGLLVMARKDFDALRGMIDNPLFADEIFGFHAQQAIEMSHQNCLALCIGGGFNRFTIYRGSNPNHGWQCLRISYRSCINLKTAVGTHEQPFVLSHVEA